MFLSSETCFPQKMLGARTNGKRRKQCFRSNVSSFVAALTNAQDPAFAVSKHIFERIFLKFLKYFKSENTGRQTDLFKCT